VGLDVVKRNVEACNGSVAITSAPGSGSCFRIQLPLTVAILDGLSLAVGSQRFVMPLMSVLESFRPAAREVRQVVGRGEVVLVRGQPIPLIRLHELFGVSDAISDPASALVSVVEISAARYGLLVDAVVGQDQVVIKSLETNFRKVDGIMGATIMGDGRVVLILDAAALPRLAQARTSDALRPVVAADSRRSLRVPAS
jgi:two-component system chemotaxis sensor kinase CheA